MRRVEVDMARVAKRPSCLEGDMVAGGRAGLVELIEEDGVRMCLSSGIDGSGDGSGVVVVRGRMERRGVANEAAGGAPAGLGTSWVLRVHNSRSKHYGVHPHAHNLRVGACTSSTATTYCVSYRTD